MNIFQKLIQNLVLFATHLVIDLEGEISSETEETKRKIELMISSSKLEYKLIKNELEEWISIEDSHSKEVSVRRLDSFMNKYDKFKNKIAANYGKLKLTYLIKFSL